MEPAVTQIHYLTISTEKHLTDLHSEHGKSWAKALYVLESYPGFRRLYWGRSPEDETKVQLHVVRDTLAQHKDFLFSAQYNSFKSLLQPLITSSSTTWLVRHAHLRDFTPEPQALAKGAPATGTAIYVSTSAAWHDGAWPLWTHIVRHIDGCLGCTGGVLEESVDGHENCYIVYVGWESVEKHDAYHHTEHFARNRIVLSKGNKGRREYGHIKFEGSKERRQRERL
ncbi:putative ABM domain-containing protein [Seiridium cardinale]